MEVLVLLGVEVPEDEIVMLKPARASRDLWGTLRDDERAAAIAIARSQTYKARSPLLFQEGNKNIVSYDEESGWQLDGRPWRDVAQYGHTLRLPHVEAPMWAKSSSISSYDELRKLLR
eukprot:5467311-Ditylum_brightwellii.AAC.1